MATTNFDFDKVYEIETDILTKAADNIERHRKGDIVLKFITAADSPVQGAEVTVDQSTHDFRFGNIVFPLIRQIKDPEEAELFKARFLEVFNFAIFPFYWKGYEPTPGRTGWQTILPTLAWCKANGITTKGHPLVWVHEAGQPPWLEDFSKSQQWDLLKNRVINTVSAFKSEIDIWDVVNEFTHVSTWDDRKIEQKTHNVDEIADYVESSLHWASTGNPDAYLILNNFDIIPDKDTFRVFEITPRTRLINIITALKQRGVQFNGLGLQAHEPRDDWYAPQTVWDTFNQVGALGYPLHITEFTPRSSGNAITGGWRQGVWSEQAQADYTEQFMRLCFGHPNVVSFNFWGMPEPYAWLSEGGLVTADYQPKPVFNTVKHLVRTEWMTRNVKMHTDYKGQVTLRGFYGSYHVSLRLPNGSLRGFNFNFPKKADGTFSFYTR